MQDCVTCVVLPWKGQAYWAFCGQACRLVYTSMVKTDIETVMTKGIERRGPWWAFNSKIPSYDAFDVATKLRRVM